MAELNAALIAIAGVSAGGYVAPEQRYQKIR
jgi:hypothetical protein